MLTDDEIIRECHNEIRRLRGVIRELEEKKRFLLIKTDGYEIESFPFESLDDASKEMERQYQENYPKDLPQDLARLSKLNAGCGATLRVNYRDVLLWKVVDVPMN